MHDDGGIVLGLKYVLLVCAFVCIMQTYTYRSSPSVCVFLQLYSMESIGYYVVGSKSFRPDIQKPGQMENAVRDI